MEPTFKVKIELGGDTSPRVLSFHPDKRAAAAFADGIAWGINLDGGRIFQGPDDAVWRGVTCGGSTIRMEVVELADGGVEVDEPVHAGAF